MRATGDFPTQTVDQGGQFVLLAFLFQGVACDVEPELALSSPGFSRPRNRGDERHRTPTFADCVRWLAILVEQPVPRGRFVGEFSIGLSWKDVASCMDASLLHGNCKWSGTLTVLARK